MDLVSALRIALRRWKLTVSILMVTLLAAGGAYFAAGAVYTSVNYVVVVPDTATTIPRFDETGQVQAQADAIQRSALVSAGGAQLVTSLLVTNLDTAQARARFGEESSSASYTVSDEGQLPVVTLTATGSDPIAVRDLLQRVVDGSDGVLADLQRQAGIPPASAFRAPRFAPDPVVTASYPDRNKVIAAILVAGTALAILLAVVLDGPLARHAQRRQKGSAEGVGTQDPSPSDDVRSTPAPPPHQDGTPKRPQPQPSGSTVRHASDDVSQTERLYSTPRAARPDR